MGTWGRWIIDCMQTIEFLAMRDQDLARLDRVPKVGANAMAGSRVRTESREEASRVHAFLAGPGGGGPPVDGVQSGAEYVPPVWAGPESRCQRPWWQRLMWPVDVNGEPDEPR